MEEGCGEGNLLPSWWSGSSASGRGNKSKRKKLGAKI